MPYETVPGTVPHRALEWFKKQDRGTVVTTAVLGEALGVESNSFSAWLAPARKAGLLRAETRKGEGRTLFWSLGDGTPEPDEEDAPADPAGKPAAQADFYAAAWDNGDVDLYGVVELEDGGFRLTPAMVQKLKRLITWAVPA